MQFQSIYLNILMKLFEQNIRLTSIVASDISWKMISTDKGNNNKKGTQHQLTFRKTQIITVNK